MLRAEHRVEREDREVDRPDAQSATQEEAADADVTRLVPFPPQLAPDEVSAEDEEEVDPGPSVIEDEVPLRRSRDSPRLRVLLDGPVMKDHEEDRHAAQRVERCDVASRRMPKFAKASSDDRCGGGDEGTQRLHERRFGEGATRARRLPAGASRSQSGTAYRAVSVRCILFHCDLPHVAASRARIELGRRGRQRAECRSVAADRRRGHPVKKLVVYRSRQLSRHKSPTCERDHSATRTLVLTSAEVQRYLTLAGYLPRSMSTYPSSAWAVRKSHVGRYSPTTAPLTLSAGSQQRRSGPGRDKGKAVERR